MSVRSDKKYLIIYIDIKQGFSSVILKERKKPVARLYSWINLSPDIE